MMSDPFQVPPTFTQSALPARFSGRSIRSSSATWDGARLNIRQRLSVM